MDSVDHYLPVVSREPGIGKDIYIYTYRCICVYISMYIWGGYIFSENIKMLPTKKNRSVTLFIYPVHLTGIR